MYKNAFIIILFSTVTTGIKAQANKSEHEYVILIDKAKCSDTLVLHKGPAWVLVKADFAIVSAKCWNDANLRKDEFTLDKGIAKVSFPKYQTMLLHFENVDQALAGVWQCMFPGLSRNVSHLVSCIIKVDVRAGNPQSTSIISSSEFTRSPKNTGPGSSGIFMWIGIIVGITLFYTIILIIVIYVCRRKVNRLSMDQHEKKNTSEDISPIDRPFLAPPTEPKEEFDNKPTPDTASTTSENIYEGVYSHRPGMMRQAPVVPPIESNFITIKRQNR